MSKYTAILQGMLVESRGTGRGERLKFTSLLECSVWRRCSGMVSSCCVSSYLRRDCLFFVETMRKAQAAKKMLLEASL